MKGGRREKDSFQRYEHICWSRELEQGPKPFPSHPILTASTSLSLISACYEDGMIILKVETTTRPKNRYVDLTIVPTSKVGKLVLYKNDIRASMRVSEEKTSRSGGWTRQTPSMGTTVSVGLRVTNRYQVKSMDRNTGDFCT